MQELEIWRPIERLQNIYEVSNQGRIRSVNRTEEMRNGIRRLREGRTLSQKTARNGYKSVHISINGKSKDYLTHRLVALAFVPNPSNLPCINHKDNNRANNHADNLEWCTYLHNNTYQGCRDRAVLSRGCRKVKKFSLNGVFIDEYRSCHAASKANGLSNGNLYATLHNKQKTCGGFIWKYSDEV